VELGVAVDVGELGDVLPVRIDRDTLHVLQRIGGNDESRRGPRPHVAVVANVAERRLGEQIVEPVAIDVHEAVPLPNVDALEAVCRQPPAISRTLEEFQLARILLNEDVEDTVAIDVDQLGTGMLEAAEERECVLMAGGVEYWERGNLAVKK